MARRRTSLVLALVSALVLALPGCGTEGDSVERGDLDAFEGKADVPSWLKAVTAAWGCEQTLSGKFKGTDSAHLYTFPGKVGYQHTFAFKAAYAASRGAAVAVYDSETGERVALARNVSSNQATVSYKAAKSIDYLVAVYSVTVSATGSYTLGAACKALTVAPKVKVTVDKAGYQSGATIKATVVNSGTASIFLGGCAVFSWQKKVGGAWVDQGPDKVCVWEGVAKEVKAGATYGEDLSAKTAGTWRLAVGASAGCTTGKPLSSGGCASSSTVTSDAFVIKVCLVGMPNPSAFCPGGSMVSKLDSDGVCVAGYDCVPCQVADCGPALGMPNKLCADGKTTSGPTGKCIGNGWGSCTWEVLACPALTCKATGCSGQLCSDHDVVTTCEYLPYYACFAKSECGTFGTDGGCAWKQTTDYVSCMNSFGKTP